MRICRYRQNGDAAIAFYDEKFLTPIAAAAGVYTTATSEELTLPEGDGILDYLPPDGAAADVAEKLSRWLAEHEGDFPESARLSTAEAELLVPLPRPSKLFLLAGNYAAHVEEGGERAAERAETFPYVFMKPPSTTLTDPGRPIRIPSVSPGAIDWELELGVVIGRGGKGIAEANALEHVAGYTIINDISDRKFRPNPGRKKRPKDEFFDWLHGKWHDSFCPSGPCVISRNAVGDVQNLPMKLSVNGQVKQDANTNLMIFPVAGVIAFISSFVTLQAGDIISTGTAAGVGNTTGDYLKPGDRIEATIESIGTLITPVAAE